MSQRLVVVSNRVTVPRAGEPQAGGLAVALRGALETYGGLWFGWNGRVGERTGPPEKTEHAGVTYATVPLTRQEHDDYYLGYANEVLWPLCHFMLSAMDYRRSYRDCYWAVNAAFAEHLLPMIGGDDILWIHDYHLIPLADTLRRSGVDRPMGFFLHIPFPSYSLLRALPDHRQILKDLCQYDLLGFQTHNDLRAFRTAVVETMAARILDDDIIEVQGRRLRASVFPVGIEVDELSDLAARSRYSRRVERLLRSLQDRDLVIGVDRLDYSKGLPKRFQSFERFLEQQRNRHGRLVYMQIANPSRSEIPEYQDLRRQLEEMAGHINGRFSDFDWMPLRYLHKSFARASLLGFYRNARAALITPLRDGMNLVAKEYVAAQDPDDPGVPVLSELAGAARELEAALLVNPFDIDATAEALERALSMPAEQRRERYHAMIEVLRRNDLTRWREEFLHQLRQGCEAG